MVDRVGDAAVVLQALVDGYDPTTGEVLPDDGIASEPRVLRALVTALGIIEADRMREGRRRSLPARAGQPWAAKEDELLARAYGSGSTKTELAKDHERTPGAIASRLVRLGIVAAHEPVR